MAGVAPLMIGATGLTMVRTLADGGTSAEGARIMAGGVIATGMLLGLESVQPSWARGLAGIAFVSAALVHGVRLSEALLGSIGNVASIPGGADEEPTYGEPGGPPGPPSNPNTNGE